MISEELITDSLLCQCPAVWNILGGFLLPKLTEADYDKCP